MTDGVVHISTLRSLGITSRVGLTRLRRNWFALPTATPVELAAAHACGSISCVTLLHELGAFLPPDDAHIHVAITSSSRPRPRTLPVDVRTHWSHRVREAHLSSIRTTREDALGHALQCQPADVAIAIVDSVLFNRILSPAAVAGVFGRMPARIRRLLDHVDGRSESGIESLTRYRLREAGVDCEIQVTIEGVGRVDVLIDGWLIIEIDGRAHHDAPEAKTSDRRRDRRSVARLHTVLRYEYADVVYDWPTMLAEILAARERGR